MHCRVGPSQPLSHHALQVAATAWRLKVACRWAARLGDYLAKYGAEVLWRDLGDAAKIAAVAGRLDRGAAAPTPAPAAPPPQPGLPKPCAGPASGQHQGWGGNGTKPLPAPGAAQVLPTSAVAEPTAERAAAAAQARLAAPAGLQPAAAADDVWEPASPMAGLVDGTQQEQQELGAIFRAESAVQAAAPATGPAVPRAEELLASLERAVAVAQQRAAAPAAAPDGGTARLGLDSQPAASGPACVPPVLETGAVPPEVADGGARSCLQGRSQGGEEGSTVLSLAITSGPGAGAAAGAALAKGARPDRRIEEPPLPLPQPEALAPLPPPSSMAALRLGRNPSIVPTVAAKLAMQREQLERQQHEDKQQLRQQQPEAAGALELPWARGTEEAAAARQAPAAAARPPGSSAFAHPPPRPPPPRAPLVAMQPLCPGNMSGTAARVPLHVLPDNTHAIIQVGGPAAFPAAGGQQAVE